MLAISIMLFPAIVMVLWYHHLTGRRLSKNVFVEYIGAVLLINCMLMLASYVIGGSVNSIVTLINSHVGYAFKYLALSLALAIGIPWVCYDICKHGVLGISSTSSIDNPSIDNRYDDSFRSNSFRPKNRNKILDWISGQWRKNGGFSYIIPLLTAIACFSCALLFTGTVDIDNTVIIIVWICVLVAYSLYLKYTGRKLSVKAVIVLLFITGFLLRLNYVLYTDVTIAASARQHDVGKFVADDRGHGAYIEWFYHKWLTLPEDPTCGQFYHPPLHQFLAAMWMHIFTHFFSFSAERAVSSIQFLTLFYSSCCMLATERILSALGIRRTGKVVAFSLIAFHPTFIILAGSVNNDILSILLTLLAIYATIKWYQNPALKRIMLIALSVGLGMMAKITVAVIAPPIAAVFLIKFIQAWKREREENKRLLGQYLGFGCVCIPLGMWYPLWKLISYNVPLNYVPKGSTESTQYVGFHSVYERLLDFSYHPFQSPYIAWNEYHEYNPIVAIAKSSIFGEYNWGGG